MESKYQFEDGILVIEDESAGVFFEEKYTPKALPKSFSHGEVVGEDHQISIQLLQDDSRRIYLTKEGIRNGEAISLTASGEVLSRSYYKQGKLHGPSFCYCQGDLCSETWYLEGMKSGRSLFFYGKKALYAFLRYKQGKLHGECLFWYPNGCKKTILHYKKGRLEGEGWLYRQDGLPMRHLYFLDGKIEKQIFF